MTQRVRPTLASSATYTPPPTPPYQTPAWLFWIRQYSAVTRPDPVTASPPPSSALHPSMTTAVRCARALSPPTCRPPPGFLVASHPLEFPGVTDRDIRQDAVTFAGNGEAFPVAAQRRSPKEGCCPPACRALPSRPSTMNSTSSTNTTSTPAPDGEPLPRQHGNGSSDHVRAVGSGPRRLCDGPPTRVCQCSRARQRW